MAEEGLSWEQPWLPRVQMVDVEGRGPDPYEERPAMDGTGSADELAGLGFAVRSA